MPAEWMENMPVVGVELNTRPADYRSICARRHGAGVFFEINV